MCALATVGFTMAPLCCETLVDHECPCPVMLPPLQDGETFKASLAYEPYFYVGVALSALSRAREVTAALERKFEGLIAGISTVEKEDLEMLNHLSGRRREYLQLRFRSVGELSTVKGQLKPLIERTQAAMRAGDGMGDEVSTAADFLRLLLLLVLLLLLLQLLLLALLALRARVAVLGYSA